jgi:hypothetical protein
MIVACFRRPVLVRLGTALCYSVEAGPGSGGRRLGRRRHSPDRRRTGAVGKKSPFDLPGSAARTEETDSPGNAFAAWGVRDGRGGVYTTTSTVPWQPISLSLSRARRRVSAAAAVLDVAACISTFITRKQGLASLASTSSGPEYSPLWDMWH